MPSPKHHESTLPALLRPAEPPPAMILAAGRGNRLLPLTHDRPKCLVEVGPASLLEHQVGALRRAGVGRIEVVTGHGAALVRGLCERLDGPTPAGHPNGKTPITLSHNEWFDTTSALFSFGRIATDLAGTGCLVLNSDVLFHPELLRRLLDDPREQVLLADFSGSLGEEEMKIMAGADGRITAISKALDPALAQAENLGVLKIGPAAAARMLELARTPGGVEGLCWVPDAINCLLGEFDFYALPTAGLPWIEIDYLHDLQRARETVWPKLAAVYAADGADLADRNDRADRADGADRP